MGFEVEWYQNTATAKITDGTNTLSIPINRTKVNIENNTGSKDFEIDVPAQIINDRTLVPARVIAEAFRAEVGWDGETRTVDINYNS